MTEAPVKTVTTFLPGMTAGSCGEEEMAAYTGKVGWRPIATAPKDGAAVMCFYPDRHGMGRYSIRYWSEGDWPSSGRREGWCDDNRSLRSTDPAFWMPLPDPPT